MTEKTQDNMSFDFSNDSEFSDLVDKPFLKKELLYVIDNNGSTDYSRNQVTFETVSLSNNGRWCDYRNAFISIPLVVTLVRSAGDVTVDEAKELLDFKASNVNFIDSMIIDYGNDNVIQQNANIGAYCTFKQHTEWSLDDINVNKHLGYRKDSSDWSFKEREGLRNNTVVGGRKFKNNSDGRELVLSNGNVKASGENCMELVGTTNAVYYYDCIINLKDLLFFNKMPSVRGANVKITLNLNQSSSLITYGSVDGAVILVEVVNTLRGSSNFCLRTSANPPTAGATETISVKVVENKMSANTYSHVKSQCRLYVPVYTLSPKAEQQYLSKGLQTIIYNDLYVQHVKGVTESLQVLLTNSLSRMQRMIIVPLMSKYTITGFPTVDSPIESCVSTEPATCSPLFLSDFNVQLSGSNIYQQNIQYKYEHFLNEINGKYGVNANMETGLCSSQINIDDYHSNFGYMVVDLSRRYSHDDNVPLSVQISGKLNSPKAMDFLCFIEYNKTISVDLATGQKVDAPSGK
jgi:hypothetical protein